MKTPTYRDRTPGELRQALRWAQRRLRLRDWNVDLVLDEQIDARPRLHKHFDADTNALLWADDSRAAMTIALRRSRCKDINDDPLHVLFHEAAHLVFHCVGRAGARNTRTISLWEHAVARIADVLYALWIAEGNK